jgi:hypothetical protein
MDPSILQSLYYESTWLIQLSSEVYQFIDYGSNCYQLHHAIYCSNFLPISFYYNYNFYVELIVIHNLNKFSYQ